MSDDVDVHDRPGRHRYEITVDGELVGFAEYYLKEQQITFTHTTVGHAYENEGIGSRLVQKRWTTGASAACAYGHRARSSLATSATTQGANDLTSSVNERRVMPGDLS